jgi:starch synthase
MSRILMVASEAAPFVKTGGLADVLGSLPAALVERGDEVAVAIPRYRTMYGVHSERIWYEMPLWVGPHPFKVAIDQVVRNGVRYFLVDCPPLFDRAGIYDDHGWGYGDNHLRYALLCQAAIGIARSIFRPDVFHGHDWQAGLLAPYLKEHYAGDPTFFGTKSVFTIHNLGYQGNFPEHMYYDLGLDRRLYYSEGLEFWNQVSFLKAGVVWSDAVTTVSPTYAREIQTPEFGFSMDGVLRTHSYKLSGILNGVDYSEWSPDIDPHIPAFYSPEDLTGKAECKRALLDELGLPANLHRPLIGIVSRFADQKGFDIVADIAGWLADQDLAFAVLGSGEKRFEDMFRYFAHERPDKFGVRIGYDNGLAHRIEAGADMFLMPSRYEPCGLNQMYSLRYGTVPIVRATGGLDDTVDDSTGFKFQGYWPGSLSDRVWWAMEAYKDKAGWAERMRRGMAKDFSWSQSAAAYQELYNRK